MRYTCTTMCIVTLSNIYIYIKCVPAVPVIASVYKLQDSNIVYLNKATQAGKTNNTFKIQF